MRKDVTKYASDNERLKEKAKKLTKEEVNIDDKETIGNGTFIWEEGSAVCAVLVYRDSGVGSVSVTGANEEDEVITTGPDKTGVIMIVVKPAQICMLSGQPTVRYLRRKSS